MIAGIVLAGGRSRRMGRPKALLEIGGETFLARAVRILSEGGCQEVVVVLNANDPALLDVTERAGGRSTGGAGEGGEQIDSLRAALRALPRDAEAALVLPVDHPLVEPSTVKALVEAFRGGGAPIVRPTCEGRHGHPVLFAASLFPELLDGVLPEGARTVVRDHVAESLAIVVNDRGVLIDVNTPADYEACLRRMGG